MIVVIHLNNDYRGSTRSLVNYIKRSNQKIIVVSSIGPGYIEDVDYAIPYNFSRNIFGRVANLIIANIITIIVLIRIRIKLGKLKVVGNTIQTSLILFFSSFFISAKTQIVHEWIEKSSLYYSSLFKISSIQKINYIFVSKFLKKNFELNYNKSGNVIYTPYFQLTKNKNNIENPLGSIVMICSPKFYKGVEVFNELALKMPNLKFKLFMSGNYHKKLTLNNLEVFTDCDNPWEFANEFSILLNLSQYPFWVETYGLTLLEALSNSIPVIAPNCGGPLEIVDNKSGLTVDTRKIDEITKSIKIILKSYSSFKVGSYKRFKEIESEWIKTMKF